MTRKMSTFIFKYMYTRQNHVKVHLERYHLMVVHFQIFRKLFQEISAPVPEFLVERKLHLVCKFSDGYPLIDIHISNQH